MKLIKLEDAIRKYAEMIADEAYWEHGVGNGKPDEEDLDIAREYYSDLPTIEVSEDCISREWVLEKIDACYGETEYACNLAVALEKEVKNAPSVVPTVRKNRTVEQSSNEAFVNELIGYVFAYPDDDYMTMECLCRKLYKHGLIDKNDGEWTCNFTEQHSTRAEGEWVESEIPNELYVCSECGGACWSYDYERNIVKSNYCPNCGAKMKGAE